MLPKTSTLSGGLSARKAVYQLSMDELLAAQKTNKSERMGMRPIDTIEHGESDDIAKLVKLSGEVLDLSDGKGLSADGFAGLLYGLNCASSDGGCPVKELIFRCPNDLTSEQSGALKLMELTVRYCGESSKEHSADPLPPNAPSETSQDAPLNTLVNTPLNTPLNGPSMSTGPGPQKSEALNDWAKLLRDCRQKFPAIPCSQDSPEALSKIKEGIQNDVASRCSGDAMPPTLDFSGEPIDTVAIWVIEAALGHWLSPICAVRLGPLSGLDTQQRVALLVTCLNSPTLKEHQGCLDLTACAGPRASGALDAAGGTARWVFDEADLRAYEQVETGEAQVMLELSPDAIAPGALPGLRERRAAGRPIVGLPEQQPQAQVQTPVQPSPQEPSAPSAVADLLRRDPVFKEVYEGLGLRLCQADSDGIERWLQGRQLSPEQWAALKSLVTSMLAQTHDLAYVLPQQPMSAEFMEWLSPQAFDERFRSFRQLLGQGRNEGALNLFRTVALSVQQLEVIERYHADVQSAGELVLDWPLPSQGTPVVARPSAGTHASQPASDFSVHFKRALWMSMKDQSPSAFGVLLGDEKPSPEQMLQLEQLATQLIALGAPEPDVPDGKKVSPSEFALIQENFQEQIKAGNLQPAHGWLRTQHDGSYRAFTLAQWRALRDEWPQNGSRNQQEWNRRVKVLTHLGEFERSEARSLREQDVAQHMTELQNAGRALDMPRLARLCQDQAQWSPQDRLALDDERRRYAAYGRFLREQLDGLKKQQPH